MDENREERFYDLLEADENDAEAQYQIGLCYLNGDGTDKDTQKAETYFRRASELGHAAAAEMLGKDSIADQSPNTENVSLPELCLRAEKGDADAQYAAAMQFLENNRSEAQRYLRMAAKQGHAMACYQLARTMLPDTLDYGCAVHEEQPTYQEAVTLLKNAVDCSCAPAAELLAQCYLHGLGVAHDREQAEKNFERAVRFSTPEQAAEQMLQLALRYAEGEDIDKSLGKAFSWVRKAEQAGMTDARAQFDERLAQYEQKKKERAEQERRQAETHAEWQRQQAETHAEWQRQQAQLAAEQRRHQEAIAAEEQKQQAAAEAEQRKRREEETKQRQEEIDAAAKKLHSERQKQQIRDTFYRYLDRVLEILGQIAGGICKVLMFIFGGIFSLIGSKDNNESSCGCILLFIVVALIWYAGSQVLHIFS